MPRVLDLNPFRFSGPLAPEDMIDRNPEAEELLALAEGGHSFRLVGPRRYGKTTLLRRVLEAAEREGMATVLVDLQDVLSIAEIVVRIERGYDRLKGPVRKHVDNLLRSWNIGLSLGGGGFTATLQRNPNVDAESVLLRLLELPTALFERDGTTCLIAFDEIQDVLAVPGADGKIRSVIQHQAEAATYAFAGSAPGRHAAAVRRSQAAAARSGGAQEPRAAAARRGGGIRDHALCTDRPRGRGRAGAAARVHPRPSAAQHDARPLPVAAHAPRRRPPTRAIWVTALEQAVADSAPLMQAIWRALNVNERRMARALALVVTRRSTARTRRPRSGSTAASIGRALETLADNADTFDDGGTPRLTDPMFEHWLKGRGLTPESGEDGED